MYRKQPRHNPPTPITLSHHLSHTISPPITPPPLPHIGGHGIPQNDSLAFHYFETALQLGQWRAPYALALMHEQGRGTPRNITAAESMLRLFFMEQGEWSEELQGAVETLDNGRWGVWGGVGGGVFSGWHGG